nr:vitamin K epoxide reductase family protein [Brevibacterium aurantiacum]
MSQINRSAPAVEDLPWSPSLTYCDHSQVSAFAARCPGRHSWSVNTADTLPDDDIDVVPQTRSWVLRPATLGIFLVVTSVVGFLASFALAVEKYEKLENPNAVLSCDLNPFFSCGSVMEYPRASSSAFPISCWESPLSYSRCCWACCFLPERGSPDGSWSGSTSAWLSAPLW